MTVCVNMYSATIVPKKMQHKLKVGNDNIPLLDSIRPFVVLHSHDS